MTTTADPRLAVHRPPVAERAHDAWSWWWEQARSTARQIADGISPPTIRVWGPVLDADEVAVMTAEACYSRLYAGDGTYTPAAAFVLGRPAVMLGALAVSAAVNHRRKVAALREAVPRWRDMQQAQVIVTTRRLLCGTDAGWESAWFDTVTDVQPDLGSWSLTLGFGPGWAPIRLTGPAVPTMAVWTAAAVHGYHWQHDPRLAPLLS